MMSVIVYRVPEWGNATLIELLWLAMGLAGIAITLPNFIRLTSVKTMLEVVSLLDERRKEAAILIFHAHIRRELLRLVQMAAVVGLGIWAVTQASVTTPTYITWTNIIVTTIFFLVIGINVFQSFQDALIRREVTAILYREQASRT